jgi:glycerol-3-phosphate O-acyltransferase/dihydroxyacetone phosphate acyltransferase
MGLAYSCVQLICNITTTLYFKNIYVVGQENIPTDCPLIICGNHSNQFVDAMMVLAYCKREMSFAMAASSFKKKVIGTFARLINAIPTYRAEDYKVKGKGKVKIMKEEKQKTKLLIEQLEKASNDSATKIITGIGTKFVEETKNLGNGGSIMLGNKIFIISKVIDDTHLEIILKENKEDWDTLDPDITYEPYFIPRVDNKMLFKQVYQTLKNNGCICIFPEGTSHDRTDFIKFKAGIAHFALGAMSEFNTSNVKIVPVGLNYFNRDEFRSEVIIEFGKAFEVPREWAETFKTDKRGATENLLREIQSKMKAITLTAPSYTELRSLLLIRKLYVPPEMRLSPSEYSELCKRFSKGYEKLKNKEETKEMMGRILKYINEIETTGISDHEVRRMDFSYSWMIKRMIQSFIIFHFFLIFALPGFVIVLPFVIYLSKRAEQERIASKLKNPNKIEATDVVSSIRITYFFAFLPIIIILWVIMFMLYYKNNM